MTSDKRSHPSHPAHPLEKTNRQGLYTCDGCKMDGIGPRYRCEGCNFDLHQECLFAPPTITFQGQECHFLEKPLLGRGSHCSRVDCNKCGRSCDACGMTVMGFVYHCKETGWDFHPRCTKLLSEICIGDVVFRLQKQGSSKCQWCNRKSLKGTDKKIPGWSYVSKHKDYNFHVYCVMDMVMQSSSSLTSNSGHASRHGGNMSLTSLEGLDFSVQTKSKKNGNSKNKWLEVLKIFLRTVLSILLGDPTAILASVLAHLVTQGLFHAAG